MSDKKKSVLDCIVGTKEYFKAGMEVEQEENAYLRTRVAELEAENAELMHVEKRFKEWFCEDSCPMSEHDICLGGEKERYEAEQLKCAEEDRLGFVREYDCGEEMQGRCWAKYYRQEHKKIIEEDGKQYEQN